MLAMEDTNPAEGGGDEGIRDFCPSQSTDDIGAQDTRRSQSTNDVGTQDARPSQSTDDVGTQDTRRSQSTDDVGTQDARPSQSTDDVETQDARPSQSTDDVGTQEARRYPPINEEVIKPANGFTYDKSTENNGVETGRNGGVEGGVEGVEGKGAGRCCGVLRSARLQVYASHFLSSWGDRMWMFAGGLFLLEVTPGSLRLAAVYGAALAVTVIIGGAPVGRWVDRTSRLTTAQVSLTVQNLMVCVCAALLVVVTTRRHWFTAWDGWAMTLAQVGVIASACIAQIGTLGCKLAIEKDWIIVICGKDQTKLARMNSVLRTVDLSTEVFAPVMVGGVMSWFGLATGGVVIAAWNVGSLLVEYGLLHHLYHANPDLQKPKLPEVETEEHPGSQEPVRDPKRTRTLHQLAQRVMSAWGAWVAYMNHPVRNAGLALASLYMTVLAFDNYSRAYVYESGVSETLLGVLTAVASLSGICGSLLFPMLRRKIGVTRTGLVGFGYETLCLGFCFASVFAPGSPFDYRALKPGYDALHNTTTTTPHPTTMPLYTTTIPPPNVITPYTTIIPPNAITAPPDILTTTPQVNSVDATLDTRVVEDTVDYTSVILLLTGIILSRGGLWIADLTVTQILQEAVEDSERGAINGVQSSLNQTLDLLRSVLIIILPRRETFGFLIILSWVFVAFGWLLFAVYARRHPGPSHTPAETRHLHPPPA